MGNDWRRLKQVWQRTQSTDDWWAMYNAYLLSDDWAKRRARIIHRDGHKCKLCNSGDWLQVHHAPLAYRDIGNERDDDLLTLCNLCHEGVTDMLRKRRGDAHTMSLAETLIRAMRR